MTQPASQPTEYRLSELSLSRLSQELARLSKKADKLGTAAPMLTVIRYEEIPDEITAFVRRYAIVTVSGDEPKIAGWTFVGRIEWLEGGNLISTTPFYTGEQIPARFRNAEPVCEHCHTRRNRAAVYIIRNEAGEWKQIGRSCLRDFMGHGDPESMARWAEALSNFTKAIIAAEIEDQDDNRWMGRGRQYLNLARFLANVIEVIKQDGHFISRKAAQEAYPPIRSTSDATLDSMFDPAKHGAIIASAESIAQAEIMIEWAKALPEDSTSDYLINLRVVANSPIIDPKFAGLAASLYAAYSRAMNEAKEAQARTPSAHVGTIGKRDTFSLEVVNDFYVSGIQFPFTIYTMKDSQGNIFIWKTGSGNLERGKTYSLKGTIKAHSEYKGQKQTELSRCAIL